MLQFQKPEEIFSEAASGGRSAPLRRVLQEALLSVTARRIFSKRKNGGGDRQAD